MVEPLSIATATIGTTLGVLGFFVGTLASLNRATQSIISFRDRLQLLIASLKTCQTEIQDLDALWGYDDTDEALFRHLWGKEFRRINTERGKVIRDVKKVDEYVTLFLGITSEEVRAWADAPSQMPRKFRLLLPVKRLQFGLFKEETLRSKINDLEKSITNLSKLYGARQKTLLGDNPGQQVTPKHVHELRELNVFCDDLWNLRTLGTSNRYSQWTLELWPVGWDGSTKFLDWQKSTLHRVQLWLSFHVPATPGPNGQRARDHRLKLDYFLDRNLSPASWSELLTDETRRARNGDQNPQVENHGLIANRTRTFRHLFAQDNFFGHPLVYMSWQRDLAQLLVALTNWSALLWNTNWTANLCPSGIRYVRTTQPESPVPEPCLHTLSHRRDHEPNSGRIEDGIGIHNEYDVCIHGDPRLKLRNLGLVLAEFICANPFRLCEADNSKYEQWKSESNSWIHVTLNDILGTIETKSGSVSVRETVQFCLTTRVRDADEDIPWDGHATFMNDYIDNVIHPIQAWANSLHDAASHVQINVLDNDKGVQLRLWPQDAFEVRIPQPSASPSPSPWKLDSLAFLVIKPAYFHLGGGLICSVFFLFLAWLTTGRG